MASENSDRPLQLFVAMPYTDFGDFAKWTKPLEVEDFYRAVCTRIAQELQEPVEIHIERYSAESGLVIDGMFRAIRDADIFIADLTGGNECRGVVE